jgi:hypothetical protein
MRESSDCGNGSVDPDAATTSEHDKRNRSQHELLRLAMERKRHADYIDALLRRARSGQSSSPAQAEAVDRAAAPRRDPSSE